MIGDGDSAITRFYALTDSVLNSRLVYANTLVFQSGDTFEFDFLAPNAAVASDEFLFDGDTDVVNRAYLLLGSSGSFTPNATTMSALSIDGNVVGLTSAYPKDGKLHTALVTMNNGAKVKYLGSRYTQAVFYNGILANAVATISGVTTTNPIGLAPNGGNVEYSDENVFGAELSQVSLYNVISGLSEIIDNTTLRILTDNSGSGTVITALPLSDTEAYSLIFTATNTAGILNVTNGDESITYLTTSDSGDFEIAIPPSGLRFKRGQGGVLNDILMTNISVRSITNALTYVFIPDANREQYTLIDGSWIGQEVVVNGGFNTDSDWGNTQGGSLWSISGGKANSNNITNNGFRNDSAPSSSVGFRYITKFSISDYVSGEVSFNAGATGTLQSANGEYTETLIANNTNKPTLRPNFGTGFVGSVPSASVKRKIEVA